MTKIVQTYLKVKFSTKDLMVHMNGLINYHIMGLKKLLQTILEPNVWLQISLKLSYCNPLFAIKETIYIVLVT